MADPYSDDEGPLPQLPPPLHTRYSDNASHALPNNGSSSRPPRRSHSIISATDSQLHNGSYGAGNFGSDVDVEERIRAEAEELEGLDLGVEEMDDVRRLGVCWRRERGTVDILQWEGDLIDRVFYQLEEQQGMINDLRKDPRSTDAEHFSLMLVETEIERIKYLVRSYVRTRLHKIEKYAQYIVQNEELQPLLCGAELHHARRYTELLHTHFQHSVLDSLPDWLQKMDDTHGDGLSMVSKPNLNVPVLIYCRRECGEIDLDEQTQVLLEKGSTHLVQYSLVSHWVKLGWAEVL